MRFAFGCKAAKFRLSRLIQIIWFMNRNILPQQHIIWHTLSKEGPNIASFTDDDSLSEAEFLNFLSAEEKEKAASVSDHVEFRHFVARRCFQRLFLANMLSTSVPPSDLAMVHQRDTKPTCTDAPGLHLSFSSSGTTAIACASWQNAIGIDIERLRKVENIVALAKRHFTPEEAEALASLPEAEQNSGFLHNWTAKEAGLKAIGKGIIFGLNTFVLKATGTTSYKILRPQHKSESWNIQFLQIVPKHLIALVEMKIVETT